jgi:hypothetical protein
MSKLNKLLESKYSDFGTKLYFLKNLFEVAGYSHLPDEDKAWIQRHLHHEVVDFYYDFIVGYKELLNEWKNIHSLDDLAELKKVLIDAYEQVEEDAKKAILQSVSLFVEREDQKFYEKIYKSAFEFQNISSGLDVLLICYEALNRLSNDGSFWILELPSGESRLMRGKNCIFYCRYSFMSILKAFKQTQYLKFAKTYYIKHTSFPLKDTDSRLVLEYSDTTKGIPNPSLNDLTVRLNLFIDNKSIVQNEFEIFSFIKSIMEFQKEYEKYIMDDKTNVYNDFSIKFSNTSTEKLIMLFETKWLKKYKDYATEIILGSGQSSGSILDTFELIKVFQKLILHMIFYFESKYQICIKQELKLSNRDFMMLTVPSI